MAYSHHVGSGLEVVQGIGQAQTKQWVLVPAPVSDQYEHFCRIYYNPLLPVLFLVVLPVTVLCSVNIPQRANFSRNTIRLTETIVVAF